MQLQNIRDGYKFIKVNSTKLEEVPVTWSVHSLSELCEIRKSNGINSKLYVGLENIGQGTNRLESKGSVEDYTSTKNIFLKGDVLYGKLRPLLNKVWLATDDGYCSTDILPLVPNTKILGTILAYLLTESKFVKYAVATSSGTKMPRTNWSDIKNFRIAVPPIQEQQKIASILSKVDDLIQKTDKIIEQTQRLKKGLMQKLLTKGIGHEKFKLHRFETFALEVPDDWSLRTFEEIVSSYKNGIYKLPEYYGRGFPSIRMFNIVDGKIDPTGAPLLDVSPEELSDYALQIGDILVNRVNTTELVGKAGIVARDLGKVTFESKNIRMRLKENCLPEFLAYFMNSCLYYRQIRTSIKRAIGQSTINQSDLNSICVPLPPIEEQKEIVTILNKVDAAIELDTRYHKEAAEMKKGLMQQLLTGQIRVKV